MERGWRRNRIVLLVVVLVLATKPKIEDEDEIFVARAKAFIIVLWSADCCHGSTIGFLR